MNQNEKRVWIDGTCYVLLAIIAATSAGVSGMSGKSLASVAWDQWVQFGASVLTAGLIALKSFRNTAMKVSRTDSSGDTTIVEPPK